jgi:flavin reductase (DIM6/NTAB) family NADH-FMN oxidoreductase RutF
MGVQHDIYRVIKKAALGETDLPQACDIELQYPQNEVIVRFVGLEAPRDVTLRHSVAGTIPFTYCIGFESSAAAQLTRSKRFTLEFCDRRDEGRVLGVIELRVTKTLKAENCCLALFEAVECHNFCISRYRLCAHRAFDTYKSWKDQRPSKEKVPALDARCNAVTFICPRPVVLVCVADGDRGNLFPMNLLGDLGENYFGFALNSQKNAAPLARRLGHLTVSTVPLNKTELIRQLGKNHYRELFSWEELPFALRQSDGFTIPAPEFAIRTKELQIIETHPLGSHDFFLAKIVRSAAMQDQEFHMIHGYYSAYRRRQLNADRSLQNDSATSCRAL